jgi:EmrB/QacA subfamily drug resistance transporter
VSAETPDTAAAAAERGPAPIAPIAPTAQAPRRLGLVLAVIAMAQLMVVLDLTIVNVALPHIQAALHFSGSNLEWVVNAYAVAFGGLLLLGGRSGDLLERRRVFIAGLLVFVLASLVGGFATDQAWLITARAVQGAGAAMAAPTALSLVAVTFPEGRPRTRAVAVYSAMAILGLVVGLLAGGLLVTYLSWRWVFFVNVPIGLVVAALATRVLPTSGRRAGRFDLPGAITATAGVALLVYGLSNAATTPDGVSHWGDTKVIVSLAAAAVLLAAFVVIETRSRYALLPMRLLRSRDRSGAFLISLCVGTAILGMFFFLTLFIQEVWGYSALRTGVAYLPYVPVILVMTVVAQRGVSRIGARPLLIAGSALAAGGMFWLSRITEHSTYAGGMLGPTLLLGAGLGLVFAPTSLVILNKVDTSDAGAASSLNNIGQQVGGSIGLAVVGTVAWSAVYSSLRSQAAARAGGYASGARAATR